MNPISINSSLPLLESSHTQLQVWKPLHKAPLKVIFSSFRGDETIVLMQVCKIWNEVVLDNEKEIVIPFKKMIAFIANELESEQFEIESGLVRYLIESSSKNSAPIELIYNERSLPKIQDRVGELMMEMVKSLSDLNAKELDCLKAKVKTSRFPSILTNGFIDCVTVKAIKNKKTFKQLEDGYNENVVNLLNYMKTPTQGNNLHWKIAFIKEIRYENTTSKAFEQVFFELANNKHFNSALNLSVSKAFLDEVALDFAKLLIENNAIKFAIQMVYKIINPRLRAEILFKLMSTSKEEVLTIFGGIANVFDVVSVHEPDFYVSNQEMTIFVINSLVKAKEESWKYLYILNKLNPAEHSKLYRTIATELNKTGFTSEAFTVLKLIPEHENHTRSNQYYHTKLVREIALSFAHAKNYQKADEAVNMLENLSSRRHLQEEIKKLKKSTLLID